MSLRDRVVRGVLAGVSLPEEPEQRGARTGGAGALLGTAGVGWALAMVVV